jgi:hypothetical protein
MTYPTCFNNLLNSDIDWGMVVLKDEFSDEQIWEALLKSDEKQTAFVVDLRVFPRETVDQLFKRLDKKFGPRKNKTYRNIKNKI